MAEAPLNEKLFAMVVNQAKAKYQVYPSPGASHWVHRRYLELGGKFEDATDKAYRDKLRDAAVNNAKRKALAHGEEHETLKEKKIKEALAKKKAAAKKKKPGAKK
jgi:hypothetical protein